MSAGLFTHTSVCGVGSRNPFTLAVVLRILFVAVCAARCCIVIERKPSGLLLSPGTSGMFALSAALPTHLFIHSLFIPSVELRIYDAIFST